MTHPNKVKGDAFERAVRDYLRSRGVTVERIPAGATDDLGDLWIPPPAPVVQVKNHQRLDLAGWVDEVTEQTERAGRGYGVVVAKRRGRAVGDAYLVTSLAMGWPALIDEEIARHG